MNRRKTLGIMILLNILWGPVNYFIVTAKDAGFSPTGLEVCRWAGIALGLGFLASLPMVRRKVVSQLPNWKTVLAVILIGFLLSGPAHLFYYFSLGKVGTVEGTILNATAPLWIGLLSGFALRERIGWSRWSALLIGAFGAYVSTIGFALPVFGSKHILWDGMYLIGTLCESAGGIFLTMFARKSSGLVVMGCEAAGMVLIGLLLGLVMPSVFVISVPHSAQLAAGWLSWAYLAICAGVITFGTWMIVVETVPLSIMVATLAIQVPVAAVFGAVILGEKLTLNMGIGTVFIVAALLIIAREKHEPVTPTIPEPELLLRSAELS